VWIGIWAELTYCKEIHRLNRIDNRASSSFQFVLLTIFRSRQWRYTFVLRGASRKSCHREQQSSGE
jgi:hypothetical protein